MQNKIEFYFPGFVRKSVCFTMDDGWLAHDAKFLSIVRPAGIKGTFNLYCADRATPDEYRALYDGYEIAEKDLLLRGPGDFFAFNSNDNLRQSGGFEFEFASKCDNTDLFDKAFSSASELIIEDPDLSSEENSLLLTEINKRIKINSSTIS